jgi:pyruvate/2-oxoglutarate/acetoin dehydrogenase E1 component
MTTLSQAYNEYHREARDYRIAEYGRDPLELPTTAQLLNHAMLLLASQPNAIFLGQGVAFGGVATSLALADVPMSQRLEFPVAEDLNVGAAIGLAVTGFLPIVVIPRIDFLLRAADALVNHLDKLAEMSRGQFTPKVIIRTRVGSKTPLDAGPQHTNDHSEAFDAMLTTVQVMRITSANEILPTYNRAIAAGQSVLVVEAF